MYINESSVDGTFLSSLTNGYLITMKDSHESDDCYNVRGTIYEKQETCNPIFAVVKLHPIGLISLNVTF